MLLLFHVESLCVYVCVQSPNVCGHIEIMLKFPDRPRYGKEFMLCEYAFLR